MGFLGFHEQSFSSSKRYSFDNGLSGKVLICNQFSHLFESSLAMFVMFVYECNCRWRPETNTFHFPFGELTITLEDVYMIMGLPVKGRPVTHRELDAPKAYWMREWQDARLDEVGHKDMYRGQALQIKGTICGATRGGGLEQDLVVYTRAYLLYIIGGILFPSSSRYTVHPRYLLVFVAFQFLNCSL